MANIMIVDDSRILRKILTNTLVEAGHTIVADAGNGKEALLLLEKIKPDLVTLDITMPVMDGKTTTEVICHDFSAEQITGGLIKLTMK